MTRSWPSGLRGAQASGDGARACRLAGLRASTKALARSNIVRPCSVTVSAMERQGKRPLATPVKP